jgi:Transglutaminase-like superfamily
MLRRWQSLSHDDRVLLGAGTLWVLAAHAALRLPGRSFPEQRALLAALAARLPKLPVCPLSRAAWAVTAPARRLPGTRCLPWALALDGLLAQTGQASELRIGVAADGGSMIKAHAWVTCQGRDVSWNESVGGYTVLGAKIEPRESEPR